MDKPDRPNTVSGLIAKRREIAGKIEHVQRELQGLVTDLGHLDGAIRIFDPDAVVGAPKRHRAAPVGGQLSRFVTAELREAKAPLTSLILAQRFMERCGLAAEPNVVAATRDRVGACLYRLRERGVAQNAPSDGDYKAWELVR